MFDSVRENLRWFYSLNVYNSAFGICDIYYEKQKNSILCYD